MHSVSTNLTPEAELIVICTRRRRAADADRIRSLLAGPLDWTDVLVLAQRHGVLSLLDRGVREVPHALVPAGVRDTLARRRMREAARQRRLGSALGPLLEALAVRSIDVVPLRCARLTEWFGDLVELDLLVRQQDVTEATGVLEAVARA